jgi:dihydroxyacetone kinase
MDALIPAVRAVREEVDAGSGVTEALRRAAESARAGAESTRDLVARYGRAKYLGEKTRGFPDPGATSVALLFEGFWKALVESKEEHAHA